MSDTIRYIRLVSDCQLAYQRGSSISRCHWLRMLNAHASCTAAIGIYHGHGEGPVLSNFVELDSGTNSLFDFWKTADMKTTVNILYLF